MRIAILTLFLVLGVSPAAAQTEIFTVPRVPVYAEAKDGAAAQAQAQEQGRRIAMDLLLRRLTAEEDWVYLPQLSASEAPPAGDAEPVMQDDGSFSMDVKQPVALDASQLPALEQSFAVFDEKSSRTTYRASITYRFKPDAVRNLLSSAHLPYSEAQSRKALVLPLLETEKGLYLWEAKNPWARAWLARPLENELTPLVLPRGDARDVDTITPLEAQRLNLEPLAALAERYRVPQVLIALGHLAEEDGQFRLTVTLIDAYLDGRGSNRRRIDAGTAAELYDDQGGFGTSGPVRVSANEPGTFLAEAFFRGKGDDFPALAQRAVEGTVAAYASDWKSRTLVDHAATREFPLTAWFSGLGEWAEIRAALEGTSLVRQMETGVFNNENAVIDVTAIGDEQQFILAMRQENLTVWPSETGWNIAEAERAEDLQASEEPLEPELGSPNERRGFRNPFAPERADAEPNVGRARRGEEDGSGRGTFLEQAPQPGSDEEESDDGFFQDGEPEEATETEEDELSIDDLLLRSD
ncbi:DUF2066 domain-containing protein [Parvularcula dongshanensis]|uniref:DUF2066 domain-containing protein n=1 Tax=Parvularcula dongshanensis TaxID=1173995 RepID=A0A840I4C7_9PROT|nr:DUF2066 domain-containing protein [Parvularcula dongshanensis]MBB4659836.1 hypothetical protein [Parvularcula dongshanensis]